MPDLGKYAPEVLLAYGVTLVLIAGLVLYVWRRSVRVKNALHAVEERQKAKKHG
jgi:heme exporter protein D